MDSQPDLNLSASGDENNKTILLDTTVSSEKASNDDSPVEIEQESTPQQSTGSLRMLDLNDLNDEELLSGSNNANSGSGDRPPSRNDGDRQEPKVDNDEPIVADLNEEDDNSLLEIQPAIRGAVANRGQAASRNESNELIRPEDLEEEDVEETVLERLIGLTEMFPDSVRNVSYSIATGTVPLVKRTYSLTRTIGWIFFSSFALLVVPVSLEKERCQAQRELGRQMLLGGGAPPTGPGQVGMAPAPVSK